MAVSFPISARYFIQFRHSDTGLAPVFLSLKKSSDGTPLAFPAISEWGGGKYYFDWTWNAANDSDVVYEIDGGAAIVTEEVRYVGGILSVRAYFVSSSGGGGGGGGAPSVG